MFDGIRLSFILLIHWGQVVRSDNHHPELIPRHVNQDLSRVIDGKRINRSLDLRERIIALAVHRTNEQRSGDGEDVQQNIRLAFLSLMIRILLERLAQQVRDAREVSQVS